MLNAIANALTFLVTVVADLFSFLLFVRLILVWVQADAANPMSLTVTKLSDFVVVRVKRYIPNRKKIEVATLALILTLQFLKFLLIGFFDGTFPNILGVVLLSLSHTVKIAINVYFYAILAQVILSWFPYHYSDIYKLLAEITAPIMLRIRRYVKPVGGFDISPIPALILLQFLVILLVDPIFHWGMSIAYG